ncbi:MAG: diheme cytochrome C [Leptolyngbya sp. IPPAS B-1204]|uniref:Diheme cytochrome C n=1 Tax=Leptolyngbya sp. NK1-12 TaxID=2547451 RepID=A0AA96WGM4_9CYAN|nr:diheme cytochrome C [Leptolyngbya sp. NK1-12]RNJ65027.1 MAG: diheme cytochrome C [Leptolyngbya sp. IPPAS B-1204]WNZ24714.1 diheme cytochrome C [Leptolyngbya sp. NK1-12]
MRTKQRFHWLRFCLLLVWSAILGWGLAQAAAPSGTVDPVPERYQLGQQLYLENCASCHVGLPPAVMPSQTWADLLQDSQHYGVEITPLVQPPLQIVWGYVSNYSRPVLPRERTPYRLQQSRYFKALHPKVEFTEPATVNSCITCHPAAAQFDYRRLTPEWENAP